MLSVFLLAVALGNAMPETFLCSDPSFSLQREGSEATLKGSVNTPQLGYGGQFSIAAASGGQMQAELALAQPAPKDGSFGRGLTAIGTFTLNEKFSMAPDISSLRLTIKGVSKEPMVVTCSLAAQG